MKNTLVSAILFVAASFAITNYRGALSPTIGVSLAFLAIGAVLAIFATIKMCSERQMFASQIKEDLTSLQTSIKQSNIATQDALRSLGVSMISQVQTLATILSNPSECANFGVDQWEFRDGDNKKFYSPGQLLRVVNKDNDTVTTFIYSKEGDNVTSEVAVGGILRYRTVFSQYGAPLRGCEFGPDGQVKIEYTYDRNGQLDERKSA